MRVGGNFYYHPPLNKSVNDNLLLIAGGVGINPLYSIIQHVADISDTINGDRGFTGKCRLLFSAKNRDELLFQVCIKLSFPYLYHLHNEERLISKSSLFFVFVFFIPRCKF